MRFFYMDKTLPHSGLYDENSFYAAFSRDFKRAKKEVVIESPFLTGRRAKELAPLCRRLVKKGVKIHIYTRNPDHHEDILRIQAYIAIKILEDSGARVETCDDMRHRKLGVIDREILWEGSMNMLSQSNSREIMRRTESKELSMQMMRFAGIKTWPSW